MPMYRPAADVYTACTGAMKAALAVGPIGRLGRTIRWVGACAQKLNSSFACAQVH